MLVLTCLIKYASVSDRGVRPWLGAILMSMLALAGPPIIYSEVKHLSRKTIGNDVLWIWLLVFRAAFLGVLVKFGTRRDHRFFLRLKIASPGIVLGSLALIILSACVRILPRHQQVDLQV